MRLNTIKSFIKLCYLCISILFVVPCTAIAAGDPCRDIGVSGECNLFKDSIQVQPRNAQQLIRLALNDENVIFGEYTNKTVGDDTYEVTDSTGAKHIFWFDDLQDSKSANVNSSIAYAVCILNGGSMMYNGIGRCDGKLDSNKLNQDLALFAMKATCKCQNGCTSGTIKEPHCEITNNYITGSPQGFIYNGEEIINPNIFSNMQIVNNSDVETFLEKYVVLRLGMHGLITTGFNCLSRPMYISGDGADANDLLRCFVTYKQMPDEEHTKRATVDFVFDDMLEYSKKTAAAGRSGLVCHAQGGSATEQGVCAGFTQEMCSTLNSKYGVSTKWDVESGGCVMLDSQRQAKLDTVQHYAGTGALFVLGVLTLPASGGASTAVIVAAIGGVLTLIGDLGHMVAEHQIDAHLSSALINANMCVLQDCGGLTDNGQSLVNKIAPNCVSCATKSMQNLITTMLEFPSATEGDNMNSALYFLDILLPVIEGTMAPICIEAVANSIETSSWETIKHISDWAMAIGVLTSMGVHATNTKNIITVTEKIKGLKNTSSSTITGAANAIGRSARMTKIVQKISNMSKKTLNTIKHLKEISAPWSGKAATFVERIGDFDDISDGFESATGIVTAWNSTCPTNFDCNEPITHFMSNNTFNNLCTGNSHAETLQDISVQEGMI